MMAWEPLTFGDPKEALALERLEQPDPDEIILRGARLCAAVETPPLRLLQRFERTAILPE